MSEPSSNDRLIETYIDARQRVIDLLREYPPDLLDTQAPATPLWTARELVAHLVGASEDFAAGHLPSAPKEFAAGHLPGSELTFEQWTAGQVTRHDGLQLDALIDQWEETLPGVLEAMRGERGPSTPLTVDTVIHEQDLRGLAHKPGRRDTWGYQLARKALARRFIGAVQKKDPLPVAIEADEWKFVPDSDPARHGRVRSVWVRSSMRVGRSEGLDHKRQ